MKLIISANFWVSLLVFSLLFFIVISQAEAIKPDDKFFVYEKDGRCELHSDLPADWKVAHGAGWVLVTSGVTHESTLQQAIDAGCPLEPSA